MKFRITSLPGVIHTVTKDPPCTVQDLMKATKLSRPTHHTGFIQINGSEIGPDHIVKENELVLIINRIYGD